MQKHFKRIQFFTRSTVKSRCIARLRHQQSAFSMQIRTKSGLGEYSMDTGRIERIYHQSIYLPIYVSTEIWGIFLGIDWIDFKDLNQEVRGIALDWTKLINVGALIRWSGFNRLAWELSMAFPLNLKISPISLLIHSL